MYIVDELVDADDKEGKFPLEANQLEDTSATSSGSTEGKRSKTTMKIGKKRGPRPKVLTKTEKKQKRLDANDRERQRMGQLNTAFNSLRNLLPKHPGCPDRELSKFETVQIAKNYIRALNEMLIEAQHYGHYASLEIASQRLY